MYTIGIRLSTYILLLHVHDINDKLNLKNTITIV